MSEVAETTQFTPKQINYLKRVCFHNVLVKVGEDKDEIMWRASRQKLLKDILDLQEEGSTNLNEETALRLKFSS